jgi:sugar phosphate isomerase/epimerase
VARCPTCHGTGRHPEDTGFRDVTKTKPEHHRGSNQAAVVAKQTWPSTPAKTLAEAGYKQIEPCILFDDPLKMVEKAKITGNTFMERLADNIWKPEELPEYIQIMDKYGLKLSSVHVFSNNINQAMDKMIETAKKNNISAYIVNCNQQTIALEYEAFANECSNLSSTLKEHGIELWIHNNGVEIKTMVEHNGKRVPVLSAILDLCKKANVGAQIDVGWVLYGGIDPVKYLLEVKEYVRSIHFKDLKKDFAIRSDGDIFACLGAGALNVAEILRGIPLQGSDITVLIDQDASDGDIMEDLIVSYQVLNKAASN